MVILSKRRVVYMEETKINVIIADDNKEFCNILSDYLLNQRDIMVTGIANDGVEALKLVEEKKARFNNTRYNNASFRWIRSFRKIK